MTAIERKAINRRRYLRRYERERVKRRKLAINRLFQSVWSQR